MKHRQLDNSATRHSKTRDVDRTCDQLCSPKGNWSGWSDASTSWSSWPGTRQAPQRSQRSHAIRQGQHRIAGSVQCQPCLAGQRRTLSWRQWRRKVDNGPSQVTWNTTTHFTKIACFTAPWVSMYLIIFESSIDYYCDLLWGLTRLEL